jgi:TPR repeat protein
MLTAQRVQIAQRVIWRLAKALKHTLKRQFGMMKKPHLSHVHLDYITLIAAYYRLSADLNDATGYNSFGICLELGVGIERNQSLEVRYCER